MNAGPARSGQPVTPEPVRRWLRDLRRTAEWQRRLLAAGLLAAAMAVALHTLAPPPPPTVPALAAAHDLPAGRVLTAGDLSVVRRPADQVPEGALRAVSSATGATLVSGVRRGELLTDLRVLGAATVDDLPAGQVAAPVRIADPAAVGLLSPGDVVDVLAAGAVEGLGSEARTVASAVRVIAVPRSHDSGFDPDTGQGALVVLATTPVIAARLAGAAVAERLSVVLRGG